jgi:hypothetical protein
MNRFDWGHGLGPSKKCAPGFLDEGTKISLVPRGPIKYLSSRTMAAHTQLRT